MDFDGSKPKSGPREKIQISHNALSFLGDIKLTGINPYISNGFFHHLSIG